MACILSALFAMKYSIAFSDNNTWYTLDTTYTLTLQTIVESAVPAFVIGIALVTRAFSTIPTFTHMS